jgi:hypothetical protein
MADAPRYTEVTGRIREQQPLHDWVELYHSNRVLREIACAFRVIGFCTTAPEPKRLFFLQTNKPHETLTKEPFSYQIGCNVTLVKQFLVFMYNRLCADYSETTNVRALISNDTEPDKEWRNLVTKINAACNPLKHAPHFSKPQPGTALSREGKKKDSAQKNAMIVTLDFELLVLLKTMNGLSIATGKDDTFLCDMLKIPDEKCLDLYRKFMADETMCPCPYLPLTREDVAQTQPVWKVFLGSSLLQSQITSYAEGLQILPGRKQSQEHPILKWDAQVYILHGIPPAVGKRFHGSIMNILRTAAAKGKKEDGNRCLWHRIQKKMETLQKEKHEPLSETEYIKKLGEVIKELS